MTNYKKRLIIICLLVILLLSSCTISNNQNSKKVIYNITKGSNYKDFVQGSRDYIEFEALSTEQINYYFEINQYTEEQINDFISKVEILRTNFENEFKILFEEPLSVFISEKHTFGSENRKIFLDNFDLETVDVTVAFLQASFGDTSNYGLCYGLACYANEKLYNASITPSISLEELKQYYSASENLTIMDLTIPVFQKIYFNEEQNKYAYASSYYFVKDLIERKGLDYSINLLKDSQKVDLAFDTEYTNEKNIWLKNLGSTQSCEVPIIPIRYKLLLRKNSKTYPYALYTPSTISYFTPNENFEYEKIVMTYDYVKHYLTIYEQDITALKNYLSPYIDTNKNIITCTFKEKDDGMSYFHDENEGISYSSPLYAGAHEYAHYLTSKSDLPSWMIEGIADYCANYLEDKGVYRMMNEYNSKYDDNKIIALYNKNLAAKNKEINNSFLLFYQEFIAYYNSKITDDEKRTVARVYNNTARIGEEDERSLSYSEASSLVNYLIKTYGEDKFFELHSDYSKLNEIYGKTFSELKEEWLKKLNVTIMFDCIEGPDGFKITFKDTSDQYLPSRRSFIDILDGKTYEYVDCGLGRNKDDERDPNANDFEGIDLNGKIALIQRGTKGIVKFYQQVNNAAKAGAIGVIVYNNEPGEVSMLLSGVEYDVPAISISMKNGEFLKNAKDKKVTISKNLVGIINDYSFED